ncbi:hypothetical protein ACQWFZ_24815, partial [Salmonella enterica subsp. enterica serovar Infantis]
NSSPPMTAFGSDDLILVVKKICTLLIISLVLYWIRIIISFEIFVGFVKRLPHEGLVHAGGGFVARMVVG